MMKILKKNPEDHSIKWHNPENTDRLRRMIIIIIDTLSQKELVIKIIWSSKAIIIKKKIII